MAWTTALLPLSNRVAWDDDIYNPVHKWDTRLGKAASNPFLKTEFSYVLAQHGM